jgi:hypothetical protein
VNGSPQPRRWRVHSASDRRSKHARQTSHPGGRCRSHSDPRGDCRRDCRNPDELVQELLPRLHTREAHQY